MQKMRTFLLKDHDYNERCYGILLYYYDSKKFRFLIRDGFSFAEYPPIIDKAHELGYSELPSEWTDMFVKERIIPSNRQNILNILDAAGLKEYDEFGMLMYTRGECCQDNMYLDEIDQENFQKYCAEWNLKF